MYKIYADNTLIYDSTIEDYKIGKGLISLEIDKSGSFVFSVYPDHFYYDNFVKMKTVSTVYRSNKIVFRGRILNDVTDYWNNKVITCEGELGFLQDSIIRPFSFSGSPRGLFEKFIDEHNAQVDEFKKFKVGKVTVADANDYIARSNSEYESTLGNLNSRLFEDSTGGHFYITHGDNGTDPTPTINYLADFTKVSSQKIEFGSNLKNYTKTVKAEEIATAIIPLGADMGENGKLTIAEINDGIDYVYSEEAVALYGWIFKIVPWDDVTDANNLKKKAETYLQNIVTQNITVELNAIDLHLIDRTIESINIYDNVRIISEPHNFDATLLCNKQTLDLLKPDNDTLVLGYAVSTMSEKNNELSSSQGVIKDQANQALSTATVTASDLGKVTAIFLASLCGANSDLLSGNVIAEGEYEGNGEALQEVPLDIIPNIVIATRIHTDMAKRKILKEFILNNRFRFLYNGTGDKKSYENYMYRSEYDSSQEYKRIDTREEVTLETLNMATAQTGTTTIRLYVMFQRFLDAWIDPEEEIGGSSAPTSFVSSYNSLIRISENGFTARGEMNEASVGETVGEEYQLYEGEDVGSVTISIPIDSNIVSPLYYGTSTFYDITTDSKKYNYAAIGTAKNEGEITE